MTKRKRILLLVGIGGPLLLVIAAGIFIATFNGSGYRETVERLVTDATGRECRIADFAIALSLRPSLHAEGITLANAAWSGEPAMVSITSLRVEIDALSFLSGPPRIRDVSIDGVRVLLEVDAEHGPNWVFDLPQSETDESSEDSGGLLDDGLVLDAIRMSAATVSYRDPGRAHTLSVKQLDAGTDANGHLTAQIDGALDDDPLRLDGRVGTLVELLAAGRVAIEANGAVGDLTLALDGEVAELRTLAGPRLRLDVHGQRLERLADDYGLPRLGSGPYSLTAETTPAAAGIDFDLTVDFDRFDTQANGNLDRLAPPGRIDLTIDASGPELARLGRLLGVDSLPAEPFSVNGDVNYAEGAITVDGLRIEVGTARLTADGHVGKPPRMTDTDLRFELSGPDLAAWSTVATVELPAEPYGASGHVRWAEDRLVLDAVTANVGDNRVNASGSLSMTPGFVGTDLSIDAGGPSSAAFTKLAGITLPDTPFALSGRVRRDEGATRIGDLHVRLGDNEAIADGTLGDPPALAGTRLTAHAAGPELARIGDLIGVALPAGAFEADGRFIRRPEGYVVEAVDGHLGENVVQGIDGLIAVRPGDVALTFEGHALGPDLDLLLANILATYGARPLPFPPHPFDVEGRFWMDNTGYHVEGLQATVGDATVDITGGIGREPEMAGLDATLTAQAESLTLLAEYVELPELPDGAIDVAGRVTSDDGIYTLHDVRGRLGENRFAVDGALGDLVDAPEGVDAAFDVSGPDLSTFAALSPDVALPSLRYGTTGHVRVDATGFRLKDVRIELGDARARVDGLVGPAPELRGTDITFDASGLLLAWIADIAGRELPVEPLRAKGRFGHDESGFLLERIEAGIGEHRANADGRLGNPPHFEGTALTVEATGPGLAAWAGLAGLDDLPDKPYDVTARFDGMSNAFTLSDLVAHLGDSDLSGNLTLDLRDKPVLTGTLASDFLNLSAFLTEPEVDAVEEVRNETEQEAANPQSSKKKKVFSDEPIDLSRLTEFDADVRFRVDKLVLDARVLDTFEIALKVDDGALAVDPIKATGENFGTISAAVAIAPESSGYRVAVDLAGENMRVGLLSGNAVEPMEQPASRVDMAVEGRGASVHEIMASLDGHLWLTQGPGKIDNKALGLLSADLLLEIFSVLNPFAKEEPFTEVECGVYVLGIDDGITSIDAIALRTDKMTMGGRGRINFETEQLDVSWTSKPRKGLGLSASAITNSYLKLGGSLGNPSLEIKPLEAMVTTGAAVATLGISILARGMWDRVTSGKKVCTKGLKQIDRLIAEEAAAR